jgi:hypothetical protein
MKSSNLLNVTLYAKVPAVLKSILSLRMREALTLLGCSVSATVSRVFITFQSKHYI